MKLISRLFLIGVATFPPTTDVGPSDGFLIGICFEFWMSFGASKHSIDVLLYRSDEQVKLICCYYCTSVTGYSSTEDVLTLQEDSLILER